MFITLTNHFGKVCLNPRRITAIWESEHGYTFISIENERQYFPCMEKVEEVLKRANQVLYDKEVKENRNPFEGEEEYAYEK